MAQNGQKMVPKVAKPNFSDLKKKLRVRHQISSGSLTFCFVELGQKNYESLMQGKNDNMRESEYLKS